MKWLPFFIVIYLLPGCVNHSPPWKQNAFKKDDLVITAVDSTTPLTYVPGKNDSLQFLKERDSFYTIRPAYVFTGDDKASALDKLAAKFIDTGSISQEYVRFNDRTVYSYDKNKMPVSKTQICNYGKYSIRMVTDNLEQTTNKRLYINGQRLRPGRNLDTALCGNYFIEFMQLQPRYFRLIKFKGRDFIYLRGNLEDCNGNGCGTSFHILYDVQLNKGIAVEHYRVAEFYIGTSRHNSTLSFFYFDPADYNYRFNYFPVGAVLYNFPGTGKAIAEKNKQGVEYGFEGYFVDNPDTLNILQAVMPDVFGKVK